MRHYEIVFLVHPDQSDQVPGMLERYRNVVESHGGRVHRSEDWGRLQLAYTIAKLHKAHYLMMNIECDAAALAELEGIFRFNDAILRHLIVRKDTAETEPSVMLKRKEQKDERERSRRESFTDDGGGDDADDDSDTDEYEDDNDSGSSSDADEPAEADETRQSVQQED